MTEQPPQTPLNDPHTPPPEPEPERAPAMGDTVGTGTSLALGCVAATLVLIVLGLIFFLVVTVLN